MTRVLLWTLVMASAMTFSLHHLTSTPGALNTDILTLLPADQQDPLLVAAQKQSQARFFSEILVAVAADSPEAADDATDSAAEILRYANNLKLTEPGDTGNRLVQAYAPFRFRTLTSADYSALEKDARRWFENSIYVQLAMPGAAGIFPLTLDPAGHLSRFINALPNPWPEMRFNGRWPARRIDSREYRLLRAELLAPASDPAVQADIEQVMRQAESTVRASCDNCTLAWTGALRFSAAARESAERDIKYIGGLSMAGLLLLFLAVFRGLRALTYGLLPLCCAVICGFSACIWLFGQVHVLTLVFGTTLLGLVIDYVLHYLVHDWSGADRKLAFRRVLPGLSLGLLTSVTAFGFLAVTNFPALSQISVFSAIGLLGGWLCVVLIFPALPASSIRQQQYLRGLLASHTRWQPNGKIRTLILGAGLTIAVPGLWSLHSDDDVRTLQNSPQLLLKNDQQIRSLSGMNMDPGFFLVEADSLDERLDLEQQLFEQAGLPGIGLSQFLPPEHIQTRNIHVFDPLFDGGEPLAGHILAALGFRPDVTASLLNEWRRERDLNNPTRRWRDELATAGIDGFEVHAGSQSALIARIPMLSPARADEIAAKLIGIRFIQPLQRLQITFSEIRHRAFAAVSLAYLLVLAGFMLRYGVVGGIAVLMPAVIGALIATGALGMAGWPLNVFSLMGLILVLGIGADYSLFLRESCGETQAASFAISLAAITTLLSFGLLTLSGTPALRGFGLTVGTGILAAYLAAPLCSGRIDRQNETLGQ